MSLSLPYRQEPDAARAMSLDTNGSIFRVPSTLWLDHVVEHAGTASLHRLKQSVAVNKDRGPKEERMNTLSHSEIIGLDVTYDWLDIHCLSEGRQLRLPNTDNEISELEEMDRQRYECFGLLQGYGWPRMAFLRTWRRPKSQRGNSLRHRSRRSGKSGELWPRQTGSMPH